MSAQEVVDSILFVNQTAGSLRLGPRQIDARVGVLFFAGDVIEEQTMLFSVIENVTAAQWQEQLTQRTVPLEYGTDFSFPLTYMADVLFDPANGARPRRLAIPRVAVVITDGQSASAAARQRIPAARDKLLDQGAIIYAVGVGSGVRFSDLELMANDTSRALMLEDFQDLFDGLSYNLTHSAACNNPVFIVDDDFDDPDRFEDDDYVAPGSDDDDPNPAPSVANHSTRVVAIDVFPREGPLCVSFAGQRGAMKGFLSFDWPAPNASSTNSSFFVERGGSSALVGVHDPATTPTTSSGVVMRGPMATKAQQTAQRRSWAAGRYLQWQRAMDRFRPSDHCPSQPAFKPASQSAVPLYITLQAESDEEFDRIRITAGPLNGSLLAPDCNPPAPQLTGAPSHPSNRTGSAVCSVCDLVTPNDWPPQPPEAATLPLLHCHGSSINNSSNNSVGGSVGS
ncbi:hypothetical protein FNF31_06845 [Cafeteria roenbergensis]|uniref:VWFA domain-containing protein n=1 Tax=Cafeteria roenbergensis TaxID=33653 RepID=A0A5A8CF13_CAFRO|nr:hypothetical protein FNF31_06845 [Cafeteria roenbergensis]